MRSRLPTGLLVVAVLQFVGPLVLPIETLRGVNPVIWAAIVVLFVALGVNLIRRRAWSRVATIFVQGFNIIVRILYLMGHSVTVEEAGPSLEAATLGISLLSILISGAILYYVDLPDVQVVMA
jgi:hypothetical protein